MQDLSFEDFDNCLLNANGKIIHQIWFDKGILSKRNAKKAFEGLQKYRESWLIKNPDWKYICWNLQRCKDLVKNHYKQHLDMYNKYTWSIQRCDVVRYFILHRYGGLYADMDYYCNKPWTEVIKEYSNNIYLVETPNKINKDEVHISNSLIFSTPRHYFWNKLFIELEINQNAPIYYSRHLTIMFTTGPGILNRVYNRYKIGFKLNHYPYLRFHPYGLNSDIKTLSLHSNIYAVHLGKGSWETNDSKILIFLYQEYKILLLFISILIFPLFIRSIMLKRKQS